jgi:transcriptional regulator with XRE-family HTH domain
MENLKKLRKENKKTQTQMATYLGITQSAYAMYESGDRTPPADMLNKLADYFNVSVDYLLGRTETRPTVEQPKFLILYNSLSLTQQEKVIAYMEGLLA